MSILKKIKDVILSGENGMELKMDKPNIDLINYSVKNSIDFTDMDNKTKDKLIKELCSRILKLECKDNKLENIIS